MAETGDTFGNASYFVPLWAGPLLGIAGGGVDVAGAVFGAADAPSDSRPFSSAIFAPAGPAAAGTLARASGRHLWRRNGYRRARLRDR